MKKCPKGVICIENTTIFAIFLFLFMVVLIIFKISPLKNMYQDAINTNKTETTTNMYNKREIPIMQNINLSTRVRRNPIYSTSDVRGDILLNPYTPPFNNEMYYVPINVRTQGAESNYRQIGILTGTGNKQMILPLMGRPLITNRDMWQYYTMSEKNNVKLPVSRGNKSCTNEYGCDKLYDGDNVYVQGYNGVFNVTIYDNDVMRYIPVV